MNSASILRRARIDADLTQTELASRAQTSQPHVNRIERGVVQPSIDTLGRLVRACGFQIETRLIRQRPSPLRQLLDARRDEIRELARCRGVSDVRIFGSVARDDPRARDIDLLVHLDSGRDILDLAALGQEIESLLGVRVDVTTERLLRPEARESALEDAVPL